MKYLNSEKLGEGYGDRKAIFDVYCENENGEKFIVEMQKVEQRYFKDRSVFYSTFPICEQGQRSSDWDFNLKSVYTVGILNFVFPDNEYDEECYHHEVNEIRQLEAAVLAFGKETSGTTSGSVSVNIGKKALTITPSAATVKDGNSVDMTANYIITYATGVLTINTVASSVTTAPTAKTGLKYNGSEQTLVNAGTASGGTMYYKVGSGSYSTSIPTAINAGTYTVYYSYHRKLIEQGLYMSGSCSVYVQYMSSMCSVAD